MKVVPWYKQFWPWFLIAIPTSSFIVGYIVIKLSIDTTDSLVVDDYYKEGKAINARLDKVYNAQRLNITTELKIDDGSVALKFHSGIPKEGSALKLSFFHTTIESKDTSILLSRDANGIYRGFVEASLTGKWQISLMPVDESWKIQKTLALPRTGWVPFNP